MVEALHTKIDYIKQRLIRNHIKACDDWISGCVEYFIDDDPQITDDDLYKKSREQYLLADLEEIGLECLPNTIVNNSNIFTLTGNYTLQMQFLIDISESPFDQLRELYNQKLDETEDEIQQRQPYQTKKKRLLKLELTDGHNIVYAMEYAPIACLNTKLLPGCKLLLSGPMRCSNKIILLEPKNISILGGELEKLSIVNAFENILLKALNRPIKDNPKTEYIEKQVMEQSNRANNPNQPSFYEPPVAVPPLPVPDQIISTNLINDSSDDDDDLLLDVNLDVIEQTHQENIENIVRYTSDRNGQKNNWVGHNDDDDDIILLANDVENEPNRDINRNSNRVSHNIDEIPDDDFDMLQFENEIEEECRIMESNEAANTINSSNLIHQSLNRPQSSMVASKESILDANYQFQIESCSLVTIEQLNALDKRKIEGKSFVIKGEVAEVVEQLKIKNSQYNLAVELIDESKQLLKVRISDDVLTNIAGVSANELVIMRRQIPHQPQIKSEIIDILAMMKENLSNLYNFMKICFADPIKPVVTQIIDSTEIMERLLQEKLGKEKL